MPIWGNAKFTELSSKEIERGDTGRFQKYIIKIRLLFYIISYVCIFNTLKLCYNINNIMG